MLAAGVGARLSPDDAAEHHPPKALLNFRGRSLLHRHIENLKALGVDALIVATGYHEHEILAEIARLGATDFVRTVTNPDYREGSIVSMAAVAAELTDGGDVLFMDADVLYDRQILSRLAATRHANCFLMDRDFEAGEEPVKLCVRSGEIVDFGKQVGVDHDTVGESVGFFRFDAAGARDIVAAAHARIGRGERLEMYEEAIRDAVKAGVPGRFGYEDITGLPWIEIDFPEDVRRAADEILPRIEPEAGRAAAAG